MAKFAFSYSKVKNFEVCPKRYFHVDVQKDIKEEQGEALMWGNEVHKHLANRIKKGTPLPAGFEQFETWAARVTTSEGATILVEQKLAITEKFLPCDFFDRKAWFRSVADVVKIMGDVALVIDWKTGKIIEEPIQLGLTAACVFAHHPQVQHIRTEFVWLKEGDNVTTREDFDRHRVIAMWKSVWPRIEALRHAHETMTFPPVPGKLCRRWCPVTSCPHHGE